MSNRRGLVSFCDTAIHFIPQRYACGPFIVLVLGYTKVISSFCHKEVLFYMID